MKSHFEIYEQEIAALKQSGVDKQSPDEVAAYLKTLPMDKSSFDAFIESSQWAKDGRLIFPQPINGKYPVELVATLEKTDCDFLPMILADAELEHTWRKTPVVVCVDPVEAFQETVAEYDRVFSVIYGTTLYEDIDVRAVLSGKCSDISSAHRVMKLLSDSAFCAGHEKLCDKIRRMLTARFDAQAEQQRIDRAFAAALEEIDAKAEFPKNATTEQVRENWKLVQKILLSHYSKCFPWVSATEESLAGPSYKAWGATNIDTRFHVSFKRLPFAIESIEMAQEDCENLDTLAATVTDDPAQVMETPFLNYFCLEDAPEEIPNCRWSQDVRTWWLGVWRTTVDRVRKMIYDGMSECALATSRIKYLDLAMDKLPLPDELHKEIKERRDEMCLTLNVNAAGNDSWNDVVSRLREMDEYERNFRDNQQRLAEAETRRKVLFEMSHSIKNLIASVTDPLDLLHNKLNDDDRIDVENALAGAKLIRELALQVHMSMRGEPGEWRRDWGRESGTCLDGIAEQALRYAANNMFSGKYFGRFTRAYFGNSLECYNAAKEAVAAASGLNGLVAALNEHFFDCRIEIPEALRQVRIGDADGTATKFLILLQEIMLNAVKYASPVAREKRFVTIHMAEREGGFTFEAVNSAVAAPENDSSGIGHVVIGNFAKLFEAEHHAGYTPDGDAYEVKLNFSL